MISNTFDYDKYENIVLRIAFNGISVPTYILSSEELAHDVYTILKKCFSSATFTGGSFLKVRRITAEVTFGGGTKLPFETSKSFSGSL